MRIEPFHSDDIAPFLELASLENWVAESWEFEFLLDTFPHGCLVARRDNGEAAGFVTSLQHDRSGWIGNLIVSRQYRGRGIGETLFRKAVEILQRSGVQTIWLTASKSGEPLYEKYGFTRIDTIIRWVGSGRQRRVSQSKTSESGVPNRVLELDKMAWDDHRAALLEVTARRGKTFQDESGFVTQQPCGDAVQLGPFTAVDDNAAERLFEKACKEVVIGTKILLDAPVSNRSALRLYNRRNMKIAGSNSLMYAGRKPDYRPELLYGLGTMGSCG